MRGDEAINKRKEPSILAAFLIFAFAVLSSWPFSWLLIVTGHANLVDPLISSGLHLVPFIPVILWADNALRSGDHWRLPSSSWLGVGAIVALQICIGLLSYVPNEGNLPFSAVISALIFSPVLEELLRAMILRSLFPQIGAFWAVVVSSVLYALVHAQFWVALFQCLALALIFIKTDESISAAILAHIAMNIVAAHRSIERLLIHH